MDRSATPLPHRCEPAGSVSPGRHLETVGACRSRRPLAGLFVALTLFGGSATLAGCGDPTEGNTGTPKDTASTTPTQSADNSVPDNSNREPSSTNTENGAGGNG